MSNNLLTGQKIGGLEKTPTNSNKTINLLTGKPIGIEGPEQGVTGSGISPKIHEQIRLLGADASFMRSDNLNNDLSAAQSLGEETSRGVGNFGKNVLAGFSDALGVTIDPSIGLSILGGVDEHFDKSTQNFFTKTAENLRETNKPIYLKEGQDSFNPSDTAWWNSMFAQSGTSVGIMAEAMLEVAAANLIGSGLATTISLPSKISAGLKLSKADNIRKNALLWAGFRRYSESLIEAKDNGLQTYNDYLRNGSTEQDASKAASQVSKNTFIGNMPLLVFDLVTSSVLTNYSPIGKASSKVDKLFDVTKSPAINTGLRLGVGAISEGSEEFWQEFVNQEARYQVDAENKLVQPDDARVNKYLKSGKAWNAFASGIFGAVTLGGISKGLETISDSGYQKQLDQANDNYIKEMVGMGLDLTSKIREYDSLGDVGKSQVLRRNLGVNKALTAVHLDMLSGKESATNSYSEYLDSVIDVVNSGNKEQIEALGIQDVEFAKANFPKYKQDLNKIKDIYQREARYNSIDILPLIVENEFSLHVLNERKNQINDELKADNIHSTEYSNLSSTGKQKVDLLTSKISLENEINALENALGKTKSAPKWEEMRTLIEAYNTKLSNVKESISNIEYEDKSIKTNDDSIIKGLNLNKKVDLESELNTINSTQSLLRSKISELKDPKVQENTKKYKNKKVIDESESVEQIEKAKKDIEKSGELNQDITELVEDKLVQAKVKEFEVQDSDDLFSLPEPDATPNNERKEVARQLKFDVEELSNTIVHEDLFDPIKLSDNISEDKIKSLTDKVRNYNESLKIDLGYQPSFEDFVRDYINHSSKEDGDKLFNVLVKGWKANNYKEADYNKVYNDIFKDRKSLGRDITDLGQTLIDSKDYKGQEVKEVQDSMPTVLGGIDENNRPIITHESAFKTSNPEFRAAYLSLPYRTTLAEDGSNINVLTEDISNDLNQSDDIKSTKLLNPDKYNKGEKLKLSIPDNYKDLSVSVWENDLIKTKVIPFSQWMKENNVTVGSKEFWNKVPIVAIDNEGDKVFYLHDIEWYNPVNVGFADNPAKQKEIIDQARENLRSLRGSFNSMSNSVEIEITNKKPGTWKTLDPSQPLITLNEANPSIILGVVREKGDIYVDGKIFNTEDKTFYKNEDKPDYKRGEVYQIRKGVNKNDYIAFHTYRDLLTPEAKSTVIEAIKAYSYKLNPNSQYKKVRDSIVDYGYDLYNPKDLQDFLSQYIKFVDNPIFKNKKTQEIVSYINSVASEEDKAKKLPYFVLQGGQLIFGQVGDNNFNFINTSAPVSDNQFLKESFKKAFEVLPKVLDNTIQNVSIQGLNRNNRMVTISGDQVTPTTNYKDYLMNSLKTNIRSFNIGTQETPNYITFIQPTINFKVVGEISTTVKAQEEKVVRVEDVQVESQLYKDAINSLVQLGSSEDSEAIRILQGLLGEQLLDPSILDESLLNSLSKDNRLGVIEEFNLIDYVFNNLSTSIGFDYKSKVNKQELLKSIKNSYFNLITPRKESIEKVYGNLKSLYESNPTLNSNLKPVIDDFSNRISIFNTIKEEWPNIEQKALARLNKYTGITDDSSLEENIEEGSTEEERDYSKSSLEENGKKTSSYRLKRFFAGIQDVKNNGQPKEGFLGVPTYVGFDVVYDTIGQILSSPYEIPSDYNLMIERLKENQTNYKWLGDLINKLERSDEQIKNEFVYNFNKHTLSMKFVMFSKNRDGAYTTKVYDTNSSEIGRVIRRRWDSNLRGNTSLTYTEDGKYKINKNKAKSLLDTYNLWMSRGVQNISNTDLQSWLKDFGIDLTNEAINEIRTRKINYGGDKSISYNQMFDKSSNTSGIFGLLAKYLENIIQQNDTEFEENESNNPFNDTKNVLKVLARIESKYSLYAVANSFRDGGKSIYGFTPTKNATDTTYKLKFEEDFRKQLFDKSFNSKSYLLSAIDTNSSIRDKFYIDHIGITSLKELGKKIFGNNKVTDLPDIDHEYLKLGLFQDVEQGDSDIKLAEGTVDTRMSRMFFPTMSDKDQMISLFIPVLDLKNKNFIYEDGVLKPTDKLLDFIYSQTVQPELDRIYSHLNEVKETNIDGYDFAARMFLFFPHINNLKVGENNILSLMINNPEKYNKDWFTSEVKPFVKDYLVTYLQSKVNDKVLEWLDNGFIDKDFNNILLNSKYFQGNRIYGSNKEKILVAVNDYIINSLVTNSNINMIYTGDLALYNGKNKMSSYFNNGKQYSPKNITGNIEDTYSKVVEDILGVNLGKRLALLIAPGNKLANSKGQKYTQLLLEDLVETTSNAEYLVKLFYGIEKAKESKLILEQYKTGNKNQLAKELSRMFPLISPYFDIESTDAQEYTTINEHLNILEGQGRLDKSKSQEILNTLAQGNDINIEDLNMILQPIKPVYTGFISEDNFDLMRMVYIKTSSIPLIPQVTRGFEIDGLRKLMEEMEKSQGQFVRASYQSGNKVGSVSKALKVFTPDGRYNTSITLEDAVNSSITLDRDNFRIQQDVPVKDTNTNTLGTQTTKLLFGDGINQEGKVFIYNGEKVNGEFLKTQYNNIFTKYILGKRNSLLKSLELDENGVPFNLGDHFNKLKSLLKDEAEKRGYPQQDIDALDIIEVKNDKGDIIDIQFQLPVWISPNSDRYESLLNSIVTNRIVKLKLPGKAYVLGSEGGFKLTENLTEVDKNNIVFTKSWDGELKGKDANNKAQVMVKSTFKDNNGNKIDLTSPRYSYRDEKGLLRLKEGVIDEELMNLFSYRIPTSSHVSMSQFEIVGFLPESVGDLMILPKNFIKQKGLDFDIDKENTYSMWSYMDSEGNLKLLSEDIKNNIVSKITKDLTNEIRLSEESSKLLSVIFVNEAEELLSTLSNSAIILKDKLEMVSSMLESKLLENEIVKIHNSVISSPSEAVQKRVNKVLSVDFAKSQAQFIQELSVKNKDYKNFSVLDDSYQKQKMYAGASGKLGIGVYSNYVTFNSLVQQSNDNISIYVDEEGEYKPVNITIGKLKSNGKLGVLKTLGTINRRISEVLAERQNTATDNEKEQIMGRVNVNELTINVDSLLSILGFDKDFTSDNKEVSVPYLLLSQPIIKDYVAMMRKSKSKTKEYDSNSKKRIITQLNAKYSSSYKDDLKDLRDKLTTDNLIANIQKPNNTYQQVVLDLFLELDGYAKVISNIQRRLNINNGGLGKSFFETIDKFEAVKGIREISRSNDFIITNIESLIGTFQYDLDGINIEEYLNNGYVRFDDILVKPTTPIGAMMVYASSTGKNLWGKYFPYDDPAIANSFTAIIKEISGPEVTTSKVIELQQDIFKEFKKYLFSSNKLNTFNGDPQQERQRLFFDSGDNTSLALYLKNNVKDIPILASNKLISRFEYFLNKNKLPSTIRFDNSKGESFDEEYLYNSLIELINANTTLPKYNGKDYTTRDLAKDLISYSYMSGGIQEAIEFTKYIPIKYLNLIGFSSKVREWDSTPGMFNSIVSKGNFVQQYLQNNPERLTKVTVKDIIRPSYSGGNTLESLVGFELPEDTKIGNEYLGIYNQAVKKGLTKIQVYKLDGGRYKRINNLGVFGMPEYDVKNPNIQSLVYRNFTSEGVEPLPPIEGKKEISSDVLNITNGSLSEIIFNIVENKQVSDEVKNLAKVYQKYLPNDIKVVIAPIERGGIRVANGAYNNKVITIDSTFFKNADVNALAKTFVKEITHALTYDYLFQYVDKNGNYKKESVPKEVINLVTLFNITKGKLGKELEQYSLLPKDEREKTVVYAGTSIYEFVEVAMTEPNFQKEMASVPYMKTDRTLLTRFVEVIDSLLSKVLGTLYSPNTLTYGIISETLSIIDKQAQQKPILDKYVDSNMEAQKLLGDENIDFSQDTGSSTMSLDPIISSNFNEFLDKLEKKDCK